MASADGLIWYKGNTHTHTSESDGDSSPERVIQWYRNHGYNFLAITDHNRLVEASAHASLERPDFVLIQGEEISVNFNGIPLHINALGITETLPPICDATIPGTLRQNLEAIEHSGGLGHVNHPNFRYAIASSDMQAVDNLRFFEVYNGHPTVYNDGNPDMGKQSVESMWDDMLSTGMIVYGLAVDDAHHLEEFDCHHANPGRGWVMVRAASLLPAAIIAAMRNGDFYASTGVELAELHCSGSIIRLKVKAPRAQSHRIEFVGPGGRVLLSVEGDEAEYRPATITKGYVRARVLQASGAKCWTQPVFVQERA